MGVEFKASQSDVGESEVPEACKQSLSNGSVQFVLHWPATDKSRYSHRTNDKAGNRDC